MEAHPNYDQFWQDRNLLPHLKNISASVLTVGGWYDTEDLYGPLSTYASIEKQNPGIENRIVMGLGTMDNGIVMKDANWDKPTSASRPPNGSEAMFSILLRASPSWKRTSEVARSDHLRNWSQSLAIIRSMATRQYQENAAILLRQWRASIGETEGYCCQR